MWVVGNEQSKVGDGAFLQASMAGFHREDTLQLTEEWNFLLNSF